MFSIFARKLYNTHNITIVYQLFVFIWFRTLSGQYFWKLLQFHANKEDMVSDVRDSPDRDFNAKLGE